jgi:hypothetical protein
MPYEVPLNRRVDGSRVRLCPPDGAGSYAEIVERGRPPRMVSAACINATSTYKLIERATYAGEVDPR